MIRAFWIELRRSPLRWALPVLIAIELGMLFGRNTDWIGVWPQASAAAQVPVAEMAILLSAAAAWSAARVQRADGIEQWSAVARPLWQREAVHLAATVVYGLIPLLVGAIAAAVVSVGTAGPGFLWPSYLLLGATVVIIAAALGHLAGRLTQSWLVPLLIGAGVYLGLLWFASSDTFSFSVLSGAPQVEITTPALLTRLALAVALVVAAVGFQPPSRSSWTEHRYRATVLPSLLVLLTIVGVMTAGPLRQGREPPDEPLCSDRVPQVCIWPEHRRHLAELTAIAERLEAVAASRLFVIPESFHEEGLRTPEDGATFPVTLGLWAAARGMAYGVLNASFGDESLCAPATAAGEEQQQEALTEMLEWLVARAWGGMRPADYHGGFDYDEEELRRVLRLPDDEQFEWARERITTAYEATCGA